MRLKDNLKKIPRLSVLSSFGRKQGVSLWLVGGFLRDIYLGRKKQYIDFDFALDGDAFSFVKKLRKVIGGKLIVLDDKQKSYRLILKKKNTVYSYDFTALRGEDLESDLRLRDFTINTLALDLSTSPGGCDL